MWRPGDSPAPRPLPEPTCPPGPLPPRRGWRWVCEGGERRGGKAGGIACEAGVGVGAALSQCSPRRRETAGCERKGDRR